MASNPLNASSSGDSIHETQYTFSPPSPAASFTASSTTSSHHPFARRDREVRLSSSSVHIPIPEPVHHRREPSINLESLQDSSAPEGPPPYSLLPLPHEKLPKYRATPSAWETSRDGGGGWGRLAGAVGKEWQKSWRVTVPIAVLLTLVVVVAVVLGMQSRRDAAATAAAEDDANGGLTFTLLPLPFLATGIFRFVAAASSSNGNCTTNNALWSCATYGPSPFTWELSRSDPGYPGVLESPYVLTPRSPPFFAPSRLHYARDADGLGRYFVNVPHDKVTYAYNVTSRLTRGTGVSQAAAVPADATERDLRAALPGYTGSEPVTRCVWGHTSLSIDLYVDPEPLPFPPASSLAAATGIPVWPGRVAVRERRAADPRTLDPDNPTRATFCGRVSLRNGVVTVGTATFVREFPDSPGWGGEGGLGVLKGDYKACGCTWGVDDEAEADMR